jgi:hypothetical protein
MADVLLADEVYHEVYYQGEWIETAPAFHPALSAAEEAEEHRFLREHFDEHYDPFDPYAHTHNWLDFVGALKLDRLLRQALNYNYARAVSLLLAAGAALAFVVGYPRRRRNALTYCRRADIAEMLLVAGADIELRDGGYTPLEVCLFLDRPAIARVLLSRGADVDAVDLSRPRSMTMRCYQLLRAMRAAGSWRAYVDLPRQELLAFRRRLLDFRRLLFRRAFPPTPSLHERLFFEVPEDVFRHVFTFWRGPRDLR